MPLNTIMNPQLHMYAQATEVGLLTMKAEALGVTVKELQGKLNHLVEWSTKIEKHCHETMEIVVGLFDKVQDPRFLSGVLEKTSEGKFCFLVVYSQLLDLSFVAPTNSSHPPP